MKKLLLILLTIPLMSFAEEPIYFDCNFTCEKDTTYSEEKGATYDEKVMNGCQEPFKKGVRKTHKLEYKYYKNLNKLTMYETDFECNTTETDMSCSSLMGNVYGKPIKYEFGKKKGQDQDIAYLVRYFNISRTTLEASHKFEYQADKGSRLIIMSGKGKCEMNKIQF